MSVSVSVSVCNLTDGMCGRERRKEERKVDGFMYPGQAELSKNSCSEKWNIALFLMRELN